MNILLLNPPSKKLCLRDCYCSQEAKAYYLWQPLDLLVQSGILSRSYSVTILDAVAESLTLSSTLVRVEKNIPDVILCLVGAVSWDEDIRSLMAIHDATNVRIFLSGDLPLFEPGRTFKAFPFAEGILRDFTSDALLRHLEAGIKSKNLLIRGDICEHQKSKGEFDYPLPRHELFDHRRYSLPFIKTPFASVLTGYGCPYHCMFCNVWQLGFMTRPAESIFAELHHLVNMGINWIYFRDPTINAAPAHFHKFLEGLALHKIPISWNCFMDATCWNERILGLMALTGCKIVQIGIESGSQDMRFGQGKRIHNDRYVELTRMCHRLGIEVCGHFIVGLAGETYETVADSVRFAKELDLDYTSFGIFTARPGQPATNKRATNGLSTRELRVLNGWAIRSFYLRPGMVLKLLRNLNSVSEVISLSKNLRLLFKL